MTRKFLLAAVAVPLILLPACGAKETRSAGSAPNRSARSADWRDGQVEKAVAKLNRGDPAGARKILAEVLRRDPHDAAAARLIAQIDGKVPAKPAPLARPAQRAHRAPPPAAPAAPPRATAEAPKPAAPRAAAADPRRAAQLRGAGLEQMNRGQIARAVALLEQASRLDPGSALIRRDLDRARRISRTVAGTQ